MFKVVMKKAEGKYASIGEILGSQRVLEYQIGVKTSPLRGDGPLAVFDNLGDAQWWATVCGPNWARIPRPGWENAVILEGEAEPLPKDYHYSVPGKCLQGGPGYSFWTKWPEGEGQLGLRNEFTIAGWGMVTERPGSTRVISFTPCREISVVPS